MQSPNALFRRSLFAALPCAAASTLWATGASLPERLCSWLTKPSQLRIAATPGHVWVIAWIDTSGSEVRIGCKVFPAKSSLGDGAAIVDAPAPGADELQLAAGADRNWVASWRIARPAGDSYEIHSFVATGPRAWQRTDTARDASAISGLVFVEPVDGRSAPASLDRIDDSCSLMLPTAAGRSRPPDALWTWPAATVDGPQRFPGEPHSLATSCRMAARLVSDRQGGVFAVAALPADNSRELRVRYVDADGQTVWEQTVAAVKMENELDIAAAVWTLNRQFRVAWRETSGAGSSWKAQSLGADGQQMFGNGGLVLHESGAEDDHAQLAVSGDGDLRMAWQDSALEGIRVHLRRWPSDQLAGAPAEQERELAAAELAGFISPAIGAPRLFWLASGPMGWALWSDLVTDAVETVNQVK
ncbi:MAG TPA: hypothetical protein VMU17_01685 [Elusimicrobiota bacterium]|nr:hypothetical protein [Elusimicrobiota bacterium]